MIKKFTDHRGDFVLYDANGCDQVNVVTNHHRFTFRGLHYQTNPPQRKTVKIIQGKVLDILYDPQTKECKFYKLDKHSEPLVIEKNYAHGYLTLEPFTIFTYAVEGEYSPDSEHSIIYDTVPTIKDAIEAEVLTGPRVISEKDKNGK
jgi:dTDP-4-dehydrorhamnose 3,5-epimerase